MLPFSTSVGIISDGKVNQVGTFVGTKSKSVGKNKN